MLQGDESGDAEGARLRYRAERRGLRETELLLGGYWAMHGPAMDGASRAAFARLLEEADPDIWNWVAGAGAAPARVDAELLSGLRAFRLAPDAPGLSR